MGWTLTVHLAQVSPLPPVVVGTQGWATKNKSSCQGLIYGLEGRFPKKGSWMRSSSQHTF